MAQIDVYSGFIPSAPNLSLVPYYFGDTASTLPGPSMYPLVHALGASLLVACVSAQTPPGTSPATNNPLTVNYGSTEVTPGIQLERMETSTIPTFAYQPSSPSQTYTLLMIDLSIPSTRVDPSALSPEQLPLAPGVSANRTTRLHFWQAGLTFSTNGTLVNTTEPVAYYNGPMPPAGDIPHDYVFYLFVQEEGFTAPAEDSPFNVENVNEESSNRSSFDVRRFAEGEGVGVGDLVAANYIVVQNPGASAIMSSGMAGPTATGGVVIPPSPSPFTGSAGKLGGRSVLGLTVLGSVMVLWG